MINEFPKKGVSASKHTKRLKLSALLWVVVKTGSSLKVLHRLKDLPYEISHLLFL
jgi:hypothetical protein